MVRLDPRNPDEVASRVFAGATVRLTTRDGQHSQFVVTAVDADSISGANARVPVRDIQELEVRSFSHGKSALAGVGIAALVVVAALLVIFIHPPGW